ncbi:MAG: exonuclease [Betaproteobacteria bacterium]|nr:MAG: exonuclease [Betaproteobacteria bacterium]
MPRFAAIDFETANYGSDSACAVGVVVVSDNRIVDRVYHLIRPPTSDFTFTHIHGLCWADVSSAPTFAELWPELLLRLEGVSFLAAHNAPFDRAVLAGCCQSHGLPMMRKRFVCTVQVARKVWSIYPTKLPDVCQRLHIPLQHHHADSDAEACARIVMAATDAGWAP